MGGFLFAEIGMTIFGIVTLVRGKITTMGAKQVSGLPAYLIGMLLLGTFPLIIFTAFTVGIVAGLTGNLDMARPLGAACEIGSVVVILVAAAVISMIWGRDPHVVSPPAPLPAWPLSSDETYPAAPPMDPANPYAPPPDGGPNYPYQK